MWPHWLRVCFALTTMTTTNGVITPTDNQYGTKFGIGVNDLSNVLYYEYLRAQQADPGTHNYLGLGVGDGAVEIGAIPLLQENDVLWAVDLSDQQLSDLRDQAETRFGPLRERSSQRLSDGTHYRSFYLPERRLTLNTYTGDFSSFVAGLSEHVVFDAIYSSRAFHFLTRKKLLELLIALRPHQDDQSYLIAAVDTHNLKIIPKPMREEQELREQSIDTEKHVPLYVEDIRAIYDSPNSEGPRTLYGINSFPHVFEEAGNEVLLRSYLPRDGFYPSVLTHEGPDRYLNSKLSVMVVVRPSPALHGQLKSEIRNEIRRSGVRAVSGEKVHAPRVYPGNLKP